MVNIETLIQEIHTHYKKGELLPLGEKVEALLEFGDMINSRRIAFLATHDEYDAAICQTLLAQDVMSWPAVGSVPPSSLQTSGVIRNRCL